MPVKDDLLQKLQQLRKDVHRHPEVSGEEKETAKRIAAFIREYKPDEVLTDLGGSGMVFIFKGSKPGPTVMIRAELDGLPIREVNDLPYRSQYEGKAHLCGHDGHMAIVAGLAGIFADRRPQRGNIALMFQPAEETGEGAARMLESREFLRIQPDYIFALHNLPGFPKNEIVIKPGIFASASKGFIAVLEGKTSHAAEPENGKSPAMAVAEMILSIERAAREADELKGFALATIVHVKIGERAFGVTPGNAVVMATLRAHHDQDLEKLENIIAEQCHQIAGKHGLKLRLDETETFHSTINDADCSILVENVATELMLTVYKTSEAFRWSEDFGLFTQKYKGAMFGLGAGESTPDLHNPDYDFPDQITKSGILMFYHIIDRLLNKANA
ncbi:Putative hydrolase [Fulvivirga imtechensis AK7]|uniref:Putative hydrolase n=1 Tax=Fulvivirga imtechensis AK7 TaxID=1237149 RepID=L8JLU0_9BACT|nr:amidohydrolase [Fulvivirga imtechensis]ELR68352.1 Putative hydrolase [Fulvivirga imtechensis AK7]